MGRGVCPGPRLNNTLELVGLTALVLSLILFLVLRILALGLLLAILIADLHLILILVLHPAHLAFAGDSVTALAGFIRKFFAKSPALSGPGFSGAQLTQIIGTKEGERGGPVLHLRQADGAHAAAVPVGVSTSKAVYRRGRG